MHGIDWKDPALAEVRDLVATMLVLDRDGQARYSPSDKGPHTLWLSDLLPEFQAGQFFPDLITEALADLEHHGWNYLRLVLEPMGDDLLITWNIATEKA